MLSVFMAGQSLKGQPEISHGTIKIFNLVYGLWFTDLVFGFFVNKYIVIFTIPYYPKRIFGHSYLNFI